MNSDQFDSLADLVEGVKLNTDDLYSEITTLNKTMLQVKKAIEDNSELLRDVIYAIENKGG